MSRISQEIGTRIRNYRNMLRISQEELAERCGLHPTYIGQLERGEKNATLESIEKVADGLAISLDKLFEHIGNNEQSINYPQQAYKLIQSASLNEQSRLVEILKAVKDYRDM